MERIQIFVLLCALFACFAFVSANWKQCTKRQSHSSDIRVEVSQCNDSSRCPLYTGESHTITIFFRPNRTSEKMIERIIVGRLNNILSNGRSLEINYGTPTNITDKIYRVSDNKKVSESGQVENGVEYKYFDEFPVPRAVPTTVTVRFVLREYAPETEVTTPPPGTPKKSPRWESHPGIIIACVEIEVVVTQRSTTPS